MEVLAGILVREEIQLPERDLSTEFYQETARNAAALFGYSAIADRIQKDRHLREAAEVLADLEIVPYSKTTVEQYKTKKLEEINHPVDMHESMCLGGVLLGALLLFGFGGVLSFTFENHFINTYLTWGVGIGFLTIAFSCLAFGESRNYEWIRLPFDATYKEDLSKTAFVVDTAVRVASRLPEAKFFIEELRLHESVSDPFLVLEYGGQDFYLEVWGEKDFELNNRR
jgi:hypothetical protein